MKVTPDQIKARAQELRNHRFTIKATLEMNAGARPISPSPRNIAIVATPNENQSLPTQHEIENDLLGKTA